MRTLPELLYSPRQASDAFTRLEEYERKVLNPSTPLSQKLELLAKTHELNNRIVAALPAFTPAVQDRLRSGFLGTDCLFLNRSKLGTVPALAFTQTFPPFVLAASMNAAKRLPSISQLAGQPLSWTVISSDLEDRYPADDLFTESYAAFTYTDIALVGDSRWFNERAQWEWGTTALDHARDLPAKVIYSQAMWPGAHVAARLYKEEHPEVIWYAEFTDPMSTDAEGRPRQPQREYDGELALLNTFWTNIERDTYLAADHIIFSNRNQREHMLDQTCPPEFRSEVEAKSLTLGHPRLDARYLFLEPVDYPLREDFINVGYFGVFYANRGPDALRRLLEDPRVALHVFAPPSDDLTRLVEDFPGRVAQSPHLPYLQFLNLATQMDYLFAQDLDYPGKINPYLPSKISDYAITGIPVIADVFPNSPLADPEIGVDLISVDEFLRRISAEREG